MSVVLDGMSTSVFNEITQINDGVQLKDPKPYREAYVITELSRRMTTEQLAQYAKSKHAQALVEGEILSYDAIDNLAHGAYNDRSVELMVCHMAQENDDDRWNDLVRVRAEERRLLDDLIRDYGTDAGDLCKQYNNDFVNKYIPPECKTPANIQFVGPLHDEKS